MCNEAMQKTHMGIQLEGLHKFWKVSVLLFGDALLSCWATQHLFHVHVHFLLLKNLNYRPPSRVKVLLVSGKMPTCGKVCVPKGKLVALVSVKVSPI
jgi:hypothetical protein